MRKPKDMQGILWDPKIRDRAPIIGCSLMGHLISAVRNPEEKGKVSKKIFECELQNRNPVELLTS